MTDEQFLELEQVELNKLPVEFRSAVSYNCYERGHAYGREEVLNYVKDTVDWLLPCVEAYSKNRGA